MRRSCLAEVQRGFSPSRRAHPYYLAYMEWTIEQEDNGTKGRFYIVSEGKELGETTYVYSDVLV